MGRWDGKIVFPSPIMVVLILVLSLLTIYSTSVAAQGLTISVFNNTAIAGAPSKSLIVPDLDIEYSPTVSTPYSLRVEGVLSPPSQGNFSFSCRLGLSPKAIAFLWLSDHLVCQYGVYSPEPSSTDGTEVYPLLITRPNQKLIIRLDLYDTTGSSFSLNILWRINGSAPSSIPRNLFGTSLPPPQQQREILQTELAKGWGSWLHSNLLSLVRLPEGIKLTVALCYLPNAANGSSCLLTTAIEGPAAVRVGPHAYNRSYSQMYVAWEDGGININVTIRISGGTELVGVVEVVGTCPNDNQKEDIEVVMDGVRGGEAGTPRNQQCDNYYIVFLADMAWQRAGSAQRNQKMIRWDPFGLDPTNISFTADDSDLVELPPAIKNIPHVAVSLKDSPAVGFSSLSGQTLPSMVSYLSQKEESERTTYEKFGELAGVKEAVQAGVMWNLIYTPAEAGPIMPVSRSWNFAPYPITLDWTYVIFDWDNFFASYMALDSREIAYSNLIQVVRSKTAAGFVPNYSAGGSKSVDRTEPPIGAQVLLKVYEWYKESWLVELLFDDLLDWIGWFLRARLLLPHYIICLGSDKISGYPDGSANTMQGARYESGLDNSPMYDGNFFDSNTHKMQMYDVGMSSLLVREAEALSVLAGIIGREDDQIYLNNVTQTLRKQIANNLWNSNLGTFSNLFVNNTFSTRVSPTTFYALLARAATDEQAIQQIQLWLTNSSRFCVSYNWPDGVTPTCYWGLPSISADDPAFPPLGYWRGYVWGPMSQLTFWSLQQYDHLPVVQQAQKALCKQMTAMMMNQWTTQRHICENFSPHKDASDCTGTKFYHWGGLAGLISLEEAGLWGQ